MLKLAKYLIHNLLTTTVHTVLVLPISDFQS